MSGKAEKATRRELRRAIGDEAFHQLQVVQTMMETERTNHNILVLNLQHKLSELDQRIHRLEQQCQSMCSNAPSADAR